MEALVKAVRDHKGFKQMAQYNVMCLISHISPPAVGWMQNVKYAGKFFFFCLHVKKKINILLS